MSLPGESIEAVRMAAELRKEGVPLVAVTNGPQALAEEAAVSIDPARDERGPPARRIAPDDARHARSAEVLTGGESVA